MTMRAGFHLDLSRCTGCQACQLACGIEFFFETLAAGSFHTFNLHAKRTEFRDHKPGLVGLGLGSAEIYSCYQYGHLGLPALLITGGFKKKVYMLASRISGSYILYN